MTPREEKAYHVGKLAAATDERYGGRTPCPARTPATRRAWHRGYQDHALTIAPPQITPEQEAAKTQFVDGIQAWLERNK